jgi:hypothetical protein
MIKKEKCKESHSQLNIKSEQEKRKQKKTKQKGMIKYIRLLNLFLIFILNNERDLKINQI